jgi:hypothetical protein
MDRKVAALLVAVAACCSVACQDDCVGKYQDFFLLRPSERWEELSKYPLDEQIDIYLIDRECVKSGVFLGPPLASNGPQVIPLLRKRLRATNSDYRKRYLIAAFTSIQAVGVYQVAGDDKLMSELRQAALTIERDDLRAFALSDLESITQYARKLN